jgi:hypothetical protein
MESLVNLSSAAEVRTARRARCGSSAWRCWRWSSLTSVRARLGRLSALSISHSRSVLYGAFVWAVSALNSP